MPKVPSKAVLFSGKGSFMGQVTAFPAAAGSCDPEPVCPTLTTDCRMSIAMQFQFPVQPTVSVAYVVRRPSNGLYYGATSEGQVLTRGYKTIARAEKRLAQLGYEHEPT